MKRNVVLSTTAKARLEELLAYLNREWSEKTVREFVKRLDVKIAQVANYPQSCPESQMIKGLYKCVVTAQTIFYYRIYEDNIEITAFFDSRQDPDSLRI